MLGTEPWSPARAVRSLNCPANSPAYTLESYSSRLLDSQGLKGILEYSQLGVSSELFPCVIKWTVKTILIVANTRYQELGRKIRFILAYDFGGRLWDSRESPLRSGPCDLAMSPEASLAHGQPLLRFCFCLLICHVAEDDLELLTI